MTLSPITKFCIVISGYTQDESQRTGCLHLWRELRHDLMGTGVELHLKTWRYPMKNLAEWIGQLSEGQKPTIVVACYSWGCGHGFLSFARHCQDRGFKIQKVIMADGVYHPPWYMPWRFLMLFLGRWFSCFRRYLKIRLPRNVLAVEWSRQSNTWPCGHDVVADHIDVPDAVLMPAAVHKSADEHPFFHDRTSAACAEAFLTKHKVEIS